MNASSHHVHIIGGGLGGLTVANHLVRSGHLVTVHESRPSLGGLARTDDKDGFRFNQGPHALYRAGEGLGVLTELGITPRGVIPPTSDTKMIDGNTIGRAPGGPMSLLRSRMLGARDKVQIATLLGRLPRIDASRYASTSAAEWLDDVASRPKVRRMVESIVRLSTYVNAPEVLSAQVAIQQVQRALGESVLYLEGGWQQLVDALTDDRISFELGKRVTELPDAAAVVIAAGGPVTATALTGHPYDVGESADIAVLEMGLSRRAANDVVLGIDPPMYLSNHGIAGAMAPAGKWNYATAEYLAPGMAGDRTRLEAFGKLAGVDADSVVVQRYLHRMPAVTVIPSASQGGLAGRPCVEVPNQPGCFVVGDWVGDRGHLADAVFASARNAVTSVVAHLDALPVHR